MQAGLCIVIVSLHLPASEARVVEATGDRVKLLQLTLCENLHKTKPYANKVSDKIALHKLAVFIVVGNVPNRIIDCGEFRDLIKELISNTQFLGVLQLQVRWTSSSLILKQICEQY